MTSPPRSTPSAGATFLLLLLLAAPALAQQAPAGPLGRLGAAVTKEPALRATPEQAIAEALEQADAADRDAAAAVAKLEDLHAEAASLPRRSAGFEAQLAVDRGESMRQWQARLPPGADVETLEALLEQERVAAEQLRAQIDSVTLQLAQGMALPSRSLPITADVQRRIDELAAPVVAGKDEPAALTEARRTRNAAERRRLKAELNLQQAQQDQAGARQRAQELELRALRHQLALRQPRLALLQLRIADLGRNELETLTTGLSARAQSLADGDPLLAQAAQANSALGKELAQSNERLAIRRRDLAKEEAALTRDMAGLRDSRTRLELGGRSEEVGIWLWAELRRLDTDKELRKRLAEVQTTLAEVRLRLIGLAEQTRELDDLAEAAAELREKAAGGDEEHAATKRQDSVQLERLLQERVDLLGRLEPMLWRRVAVLEQTERTLQLRIGTTSELQQMLDRHLLWIRSHPPVGPDWLGQIPAGFYDLLKPARFVTTAELVQRSFAQRPWSWLASLVVVVGLLILQRRALPRMRQLAQHLRDVRSDRLVYTVECLAWTLVASLPWVVALRLFGQLLQGIGTAGKFSDSLGRALVAMSLPLLIFGFLRWLVTDRGLA
ncbi:MAG: hypothetical protein KA196_04785, partial [Arenimonas sp.]|nr:hypothetical protein [Arenimonas sp.]